MFVSMAKDEMGSIRERRERERERQRKTERERERQRETEGLKLEIDINRPVSFLQLLDHFLINPRVVGHLPTQHNTP